MDRFDQGRPRKVPVSQEPLHASDPRVGMTRDRTGMAIFRTQLALDRTTLAWVRTALAMTSFGFGMVGFFRTLRQQNPDAETIRLHHDAIAMGTALIVMGIVALVLAGLVIRLSSLLRHGRSSPFVENGHSGPALDSSGIDV